MKKIAEMKSTPTGKSYWNSTGAYTPEYEKLYDELVPIQGSAETLNGELVRAISRLQHEYYNNGNCNACEIEWGEESWGCSNCGGSGTVMDYEYDEEEGEIEIEVDCDCCGGSGEEIEEVEVDSYVSEFYSMFLKLIEHAIPTVSSKVEIIKDFIAQNQYSVPNQFADIHMDKYNSLIDEVMYYVINNEDKELPHWYEN